MLNAKRDNPLRHQGFTSATTFAAALSLAALVFTLPSCSSEQSEPTEPENNAEQWNSRTELIAAPPGSAGELSELQQRSPESLSDQERRELERQRREARDRRRLSTAVGPPISLSGQIVSRATGEPEQDCDISVGNSDALSDEEGHFFLERVPSGGLVRVRFNCRGLIERQTVEVPAGRASYELPAPIELGPSSGRAALADESDEESASGEPTTRAPGATMREALADLAGSQNDDEGQSNEEDDERVSLLGNAANALAHLAGTAAAVAPPEEGERYELLGHRERAAEHYEARSDAERYMPADGEGAEVVREQEPEFPNTPYRRQDDEPATGEAQDDAGERGGADAPSVESARGEDDTPPTSATPREDAAQGQVPEEPTPPPATNTDTRTTSAPRSNPQFAERISGTLGEADVHGEMRRRAHALRNCYSSPLEADWELVGSVEVSWRISQEGVVEEATLLDSTFDNEELDSCFIRRIERLDFPESTGTTEVHINFVYNIWDDPTEPFSP